VWLVAATKIIFHARHTATAQARYEEGGEMEDVEV